MINPQDYSLLLDVGKGLLIPILLMLGGGMKTVYDRRTASKNTVVDQIFSLVQKITDDNSRLRTERDESKTQCESKQRQLDALEYQKRDFQGKILDLQVDVRQVEAEMKAAGFANDSITCLLVNIKTAILKIARDLKPDKSKFEPEKASLPE